MFAIFNQIITLLCQLPTTRKFFSSSPLWNLFVQNLKRTRIYNLTTEIQIDMFEYTGLSFLKSEDS